MAKEWRSDEPPHVKHSFVVLAQHYAPTGFAVKCSMGSIVCHCPMTKQCCSLNGATKKSPNEESPYKRSLTVLRVLVTLDFSYRNLPVHNVWSYVFYALRLQRAVRTTLSPVFKFRLFSLKLSSLGLFSWCPFNLGYVNGNAENRRKEKTSCGLPSTTINWF